MLLLTPKKNINLNTKKTYNLDVLGDLEKISSEHPVVRRGRLGSQRSAGTYPELPFFR